MIMSKYFPYIIIVVLIIAYFKACGKPIKTPAVNTTHDTIKMPGDSIDRIVVVKLPVPITKIIHDTTYKTLKIDTLAILAQYFERITYSDTIKDSLLIAYITDVVAQNRIIDRKFKYKNLRQTEVIINNTTTVNKPNWYVGGGLYVGQKLGVGPSVSYSTQTYNISAGYDIINKMVRADYLININQIFKQKK